MTIKVILADDEPLIVKGLRKLVAWHELGMEIVAQAYDGEELLEAITAHKPDLVISDINMPHCTGIEILKEIGARQWNTKIVFISAYQEFAYARDAVAFGAVDYLVKPVEKEQLERVLARAVSQIREEDEETRRKDKLQFIERKRKSEEMREGIERLLEGALSAESLLYRKLDAELSWPYMTAAALELDMDESGSERWPAHERRLIHFAVDNVLQDSLTGRGFAFVRNNRFALLIGHEEPALPLVLARDIQRNIATYLKLRASIGIGQTAKEIGGLAESSRQAEAALDIKYFVGRESVVVYEPVSPEPDAGHLLYGLQEEAVKALTGGQWGSALEALNRLLAGIRAATYGNRGLAVSTAFASVMNIVQEIIRKGVPVAEGPFEIHGLQAMLGRFETFDELSEGVRRILEQLNARIDDKAGNRDKLLLARIKQYIEEHYADEISLESVAAVAFMNPYYFSTFFKKHTRENFKAYVTNVRMKRAAVLLAETDLLVYEIAEKVGYQSARHFSEVFKKTYGKLPQEYKSSLKK